MTQRPLRRRFRPWDEATTPGRWVDGWRELAVYCVFDAGYLVTVGQLVCIGGWWDGSCGFLNAKIYLVGGHKHVFLCSGCCCSSHLTPLRLRRESVSKNFDDFSDGHTNQPVPAGVGNASELQFKSSTTPAQRGSTISTTARCSEALDNIRE